MSVTVILFNEQGQNQLTVELSNALKKQTVKPKVFIWNNNPTRIRSEAADWVINSTQPIGKKALSLMACQADTDYVCRFDNDIYPKDRWIIDDAISLHEQVCTDNRILGAFGVNLDYEENEFINTPNEDIKVDAIYGKFYVVKRVAITQLNTYTDLSLSLKLAVKPMWQNPAMKWPVRKGHVVGGCFNNRFWKRVESETSLNKTQIKRWLNQCAK